MTEQAFPTTAGQVRLFGLSLERGRCAGGTTGILDHPCDGTADRFSRLSDAAYAAGAISVC